VFKKSSSGNVTDEPPPAAVAPVTNLPAEIAPDPNRTLKEKYAKYLQVPADSIVNIKLYAFIDKWLNTPYKWGGTDENGIDCSAFIQRLLNEVYDLKLPRTSIEQLYTNRVELFTSHKYFSEGDIIFFRTMKNKTVSHVGIYLSNYMFVNSSSSKGVSIASLKDDYWRQRYVVAGRIKVSVAKN
jgi:lipoprotein Spr